MDHTGRHQLVNPAIASIFSSENMRNALSTDATPLRRFTSSGSFSAANAAARW